MASCDAPVEPDADESFAFLRDSEGNLLQIDFDLVAASFSFSSVDYWCDDVYDCGEKCPEPPEGGTVRCTCQKFDDGDDDVDTENEGRFWCVVTFEGAGGACGGGGGMEGDTLVLADCRGTATFSLVCPSGPVTRGTTDECRVQVTGGNASFFAYVWVADDENMLAARGIHTWRGTAASSRSISVRVKRPQSDSILFQDRAYVTVVDRGWNWHTDIAHRFRHWDEEAGFCGSLARWGEVHSEAGCGEWFDRDGFTASDWNNEGPWAGVDFIESANAAVNLVATIHPLLKVPHGTRYTLTTAPQALRDACAAALGNDVTIVNAYEVNVACSPRTSHNGSAAFVAARDHIKNHERRHQDAAKTFVETTNDDIHAIWDGMHRLYGPDELAEFARDAAKPARDALGVAIEGTHTHGTTSFTFWLFWDNKWDWVTLELNN